MLFRLSVCSFAFVSVQILVIVLCDTSARSEVRGTADVGWRSLNPLPINPPRTHSRLYHHMCLRTDGRWRTWMERDADAALRTILTQFVAMGVVYAVGPVRPPHSAPNTNYHLLGWRSTVQTFAHERRKGTLIVRWRSDILAHLCPRLHWLWVTVEPHITGTRQRGGCSSEGGSLRPCTPSFGLGTTKP